jgi:hypothetical protein
MLFVTITDSLSNHLWWVYRQSGGAAEALTRRDTPRRARNRAQVRAAPTAWR